jgi:hypothetical protein
MILVELTKKGHCSQGNEHMKITQKQIEAIIVLQGPKRYEHFIKVAADQRRVWGLYSDGWALASTNDSQTVFPLWPAREYAALCAVGEWAGYATREIDLDDLFEHLLPSLKERNTLLGVFYTPTDKGVLPILEEFECDLRAELAKIE